MPAALTRVEEAAFGQTFGRQASGFTLCDQIRIRRTVEYGKAKGRVSNATDHSSIALKIRVVHICLRLGARLVPFLLQSIKGASFTGVLLCKWHSILPGTYV